jgi:uncharacterized protein YbcV (DUF1398 family)
MSYYIVSIKWENKKLINEQSYKVLVESLRKWNIIQVNKDIFDKFLFERVKEVDYPWLEEEILKLSDYWKRTFKADLLNYWGDINSKTVTEMLNKAKKL